MQHDWKWLVVYNDGAEVQESEGMSFESLQLNKVKMLIVTDMLEQKNQYAIHFTKEMRPIFFRRYRGILVNDPEHVPIEYVNEDGTLKEKLCFATVLGWQSTINGKNVKSLTWLLHDGSVAITDRDIDLLQETQ